MKNIFILLCSLFVLSSCEDPIKLEIDAGQKQLVVDAFLNNLSEQQMIKLQLSKEFFDENSQEPIIGATVKVTDSDGKVYNFSDIGNKGEYTWTDSVLVHEGKTYSLQINYNGQTYTSTSKANPVPAIDSLVFSVSSSGFGSDSEGYFLEYFVNDLPGREDFYRAIVYREGKLITSNNGIVVSIDGAFGAGNDGLPFIFPIRAGLNDGESPYQLGEKVKVELMSINKEVYFFFNQVNSQINNGGLFAVPPSNVRTNIVSSSNDIANKGIGMFSVSMVSALEKTVQE